MALVHIHSLLAWLLLAALVLSIVIALVKKSGGKPFSSTDRTLFLVTFILTHLQLLLGLVQYFLSEKVQWVSETMSTTVLRFFALEHPLTMILGIAAITVGYMRAKRADADGTKFKHIYLWYGIGLVLILLRFPWQYLSVIGKGWFS